jgi:hypothetical protein
MQDILNLIRQKGPDQLESFCLSFIMCQGSRTKFYLLNHLPKIPKQHPLDLLDGIEIFLAAVYNMFLQDVIDCWGVV